MNARMICASGHCVGRRHTRRVLILAVACALLRIYPASAATVSLKAFDRIAKNVELAYIQSGTSEIKRLPMERQVFGVWQVDFPVPAGDYEYRFVIDGEWISDIDNPDFNRWDDGSIWSRLAVPDENGHYANYRLVEADKPAETAPKAAKEPAAATPENVAGKINVTFRFYAPLAKKAAVVGAFNGWNGEQNPMSLRGGMGSMMDASMRAFMNRWNASGGQ